MDLLLPPHSFPPFLHLLTTLLLLGSGIGLSLAGLSTAIPKRHLCLRPTIAPLAETSTLFSTTTSSPQTKSLHKQLLYLGRNTRPDAPPHPPAHFLLGPQHLLLNQGQHLFLTKPPHSQQWSPACQQDSHLHLTLEAYTATEAFLTLQDSTTCQGLHLKTIPKTDLDPLPTTIALPPDPLFALYGGQERAQQATSYRLFFPATQHIVPIRHRDLLSLTTTHWQPTPLTQLCQQTPCADVQAASANGVLLAVWDAQGWTSRQIHLPLQRHTPQEQKTTVHQLQQWLKQKKTPHLAAGDWWISTTGHWKKISSLAEMEALLAYHHNGPLLIIDAIDPQKQHSWLHGHLFDRLRTTATKIHLPLPKSSLHQQTPAALNP